MNRWPLAVSGIFLFLFGFVLGGVRPRQTAESLDSQAYPTSIRKEKGQYVHTTELTKSAKEASAPHFYEAEYSDAISLIASKSSVGVHDLKSIGLKEPELEKLKLIRNRALERIKEIEATHSTPTTFEPGKEGVTIGAFPQEYDAWRSNLESEVSSAITGSARLIAVAVIESELGRQSRFGHLERRIWTSIHDGSNNTYTLNTQYVIPDGSEGPRWTQSFYGNSALPRYDHIYSNPE